MNPEDYVSYPLALALKKAGFDEPCRYYYNPKGMLRKAKDNALSPEVLNNRYLDEIADGVCSAVPLWQAQKWLRDIFLLHVGANPALPTRKWQFYIDDLNQQINPYDGELMTRWDDDMQEKADEHLHDTYESALSAGIAAALELIEKKGE